MKNLFLILYLYYICVILIKLRIYNTDAYIILYIYKYIGNGIQISIDDN